MDKSRVNTNRQESDATKDHDEWAEFGFKESDEVQAESSYKVRTLESQIGSLSLLEPTVHHHQPLQDNGLSYLSSSIRDERINGGAACDRYLFPLPSGAESNQSQGSQNLLVNGRTFGCDATTLTNGSLSLMEPTVHHPQPLQDNNLSYLSSSIHDERINGVAAGDRYLFPLQSQRSQNSLVNGRTFGCDATTLNNGFLNGNSTMNRLYNQSSRISNNGSGVNNPWRRSNYNLMVLRAKDRVYSQQLKNKILVGSKEMVDKIFDEVIFDINELMVDPFGNQVLQKLMEKCSSEKINQILDIVTQQQFPLIPICTDPIGARGIQSLLKCLRSEEQVLRTVEAISIVALVLTRSNNAKHVILHCFNQFPPALIRNLIEVICSNCYQIATDQHGCCLLQQCLSCGCDELKRRLIAEIVTNVFVLCLDSYGNYVVQYVVELNHPNVTQDLINMLRGNYSYLFRNKYGSHVVQKFLKNRFIDSRLIVNDLLEDITALLTDPYGNYVIQTAWSVSQGDVRNQLLMHIQNNLKYIKYNKFGIILLKKIGLWSSIC